MQRILITGMSGTGKSTVILELRRKGYHAVDADEDGMSELVPAPGELTGVGEGMDWVWRPDRIQRALNTESADVLFLGGCSPNQRDFYARFDRVILLTASKPVIAERLKTRSTNNFGKRPEELANTLKLIDEIEPLLRQRADVVIDAESSLDNVLNQILAFVSDPQPAHRGRS